ncbi:MULTISPECIES: amino acid permease [Ensifer]|uniref:amino acid permease n=1 Tax=Ensifer TaxID=106591 RepID=UPI00088CDEF1|nr:MULTISPECIES: amino acid permease [Ensifer]MCY1739487.1 amino acid permease [Ensifer sp. SL37]RAS08930.1 amino acid/polyamine/organocation transporter (APC superfamily) [Ensifer adhaerens]SDN08309.1 basic amino acid/polyamine antiporter, APA family [Ensifer sp. YR511]
MTKPLDATSGRSQQTTPEMATRPSLGIWACSALVVGNIIGSGFYLSPAALAPYGAAALVGWVCMAVAAMCLGLVFARLAGVRPATGGPYAYSRMAFGPFAGFLVAWAYWISIWASLPAIAMAFTGYLGVFVPNLQHMPGGFTAVSLAAMWLVAAINMFGVRSAGRFQIVTVGLKLLPFIAIALLGLFWIEPQNLTPINPSGLSMLGLISATAPLTMFAFLGIESATVPAGDVDDPKRTIPRATVLGTLCCGLIFILGTLVVMGTVPRETLTRSAAPFSDAAFMMWGWWGSTLVAAAVVLSSIGALNGWTLLMAQVPMAAARDGLFPPVFGRLSSRGVPQWGIVLSMLLASALLVLQTSGVSGLMAVYRFAVDLSTTAAMVPYVFCSLVEGALFLALTRPRDEEWGGFRLGPYKPYALVAFIFSLWTVYGSGPQAGLWCLLLLLVALPVYLSVERKEPSTG